MWLEQMRQFLKIVSFMGFMATGPMMVAVTYKTVREKYPVEVKRYSWIFWVMSLFLSTAFFALFQVLFPDNPPIPGGIFGNR